MKTALKVLCTTILAWAALATAAQASTLKDISFEDQPKKIVVRLLFSEPVSAEVISHFTNNFVGLNIEGLEFSKKQDGKKYTPPGDNAQFLKHVLLQSDDGGGQIRFYMGVLCTPADAQVVPLDNKIVVEIVKPLWKLGQTDDTEAPAGDEDQSGASGEDNSTQDTGDTNSSGGFIPDDNQTPPDEGSTPSDTGGLDSQTGGSATPPQGGTSQPGGFTPGPAYTLFDLDQVPVNQLDIRGMPFDEALVQLVEGTGFNVVVGPGIDDAEVNLSFTQKGISLKSALDLLCKVYALTYTVDKDAIVITAKQ